MRETNSSVELSLHAIFSFYEFQFKDFVYLFFFDGMGIQYERYGYAALRAC